MSKEDWKCIISSLYPNRLHCKMMDSNYIEAWHRIVDTKHPKLIQKLAHLKSHISQQYSKMIDSDGFFSRIETENLYSAAKYMQSHIQEYLHPGISLGQIPDLKGRQFHGVQVKYM